MGYKDQKRDIYVTKDDFHINQEGSDVLEDIEFNLSFKTNNDFEKSCFIELYNQSSDTFDLNYSYTLKNKYNFEFISPNRWGGEKEGQIISPEVFDLFHHVYLGALRDAKRHLRPGKNNQIGRFFSKVHLEELGDEFNKEKMINKLNDAIKDEKIFDFIEQAKRKYIDIHLSKITFNNEININFEFLPETFDEFVNNFKIILPYFNEIINKEQKYLELYQNGLGYNNLIYISILLGDLKDLNKIQEGLFVALLIEEPEAHLHPQLQNLFFKYINELNSEINSDVNQNFQIFISSHSPTLTAKADLDSLTILQNVNNNLFNIALKNSNLLEENKEYLFKFLDVTKSQLFFAKSVILVEGVSELILVPEFARLLGFDLEENSVEVVNVSGVAFKHFIPLFSNNLTSLSKDYKEINGNILSSKCAIITDDDRKELEGDISPTLAMINNCADQNLKIFSSVKTFEHELFKENLDDLCMLEKIYKDVHRDLCKKFFNRLDKENNAEKVIHGDLKITKKSKFAFELAMKLKDCSDEEDFKVPTYIKEAIKFACEK